MKRNKISHISVFVGGRTVVTAALICLVVAAVSCRSVKTVTVEVPVYVHDTTEKTKYVHDSTVIENTIKEYIKGDTCFIERWHTKYRDREVHDTTYIFKEVPVEVPTTETVYVDKDLTWLQRTLIGCGVLFIASFVVCIFVLVLGLKKR